nr:unnamed protein product [Spirometra erinaceieuropaei]
MLALPTFIPRSNCSRRTPSDSTRHHPGKVYFYSLSRICCKPRARRFPVTAVHTVAAPPPSSTDITLLASTAASTVATSTTTTTTLRTLINFDSSTIDFDDVHRMPHSRREQGRAGAQFPVNSSSSSFSPSPSPSSSSSSSSSFSSSSSPFSTSSSSSLSSSSAF